MWTSRIRLALDLVHGSGALIRDTNIPEIVSWTPLSGTNGAGRSSRGTDPIHTLGQVIKCFGLITHLSNHPHKITFLDVVLPVVLRSRHSELIGELAFNLPS